MFDTITRQSIVSYVIRQLLKFRILGFAAGQGVYEARTSNHDLPLSLQPRPVASLHLRDPEGSGESGGGQLLRIHALDCYPEGHTTLGGLF